MKIRVCSIGLLFAATLFADAQPRRYPGSEAIEREREQFFATQCLIIGKVTQKHRSGRITVMSQPGNGKYPEAPRFYTEVRDVDTSAVHVGDWVKFFGYEGRYVTVELLNGEEEKRVSLSIAVPEKFKDDTRTKLPETESEIRQWHIDHPAPTPKPEKDKPIHDEH